MVKKSCYTIKTCLSVPVGGSDDCDIVSQVEVIQDGDFVLVRGELRAVFVSSDGEHHLSLCPLVGVC